MIEQRFPATVPGDEAYEPVVDLVPLCGSPTEVADQGGPGLIDELLQLEFPQQQPVALAVFGVGGNEDARP